MVSAQIKSIMFELDAHVRIRMARLAVLIIQNLSADPSQGGTPRDTGWASSNWLATTGTAPTGPVGSKKAVTYGPQQSSINGLIRYRLSDGPIVIYNNTPHIGILNAGSSTQAPANFVQSAIARALLSVKGIKGL